MRKKLAYNMRAMTLDEVGKEMGISKERVRQLEERALRKLRQALGDLQKDDILPDRFEHTKS